MRTLNQNTLERMETYIKEYQTEHRQSPSYRDIMHALDMSSLNLVQRYVLALERADKIHRTSKGNIKMPKCLEIGQSTIVPLVGSIACGQPSFAEEYVEGSYALPADIFGYGNLFLLHAFGDSMVEVGIEQGDLIVIRKQNIADNGDIVVALVDGETTLKRFYCEEGKIILHPENKLMKDIMVNNCEIQGVLVSCIKMY